jgi:hypothetical protein
MISPNNQSKIKGSPACSYDVSGMQNTDEVGGVDPNSHLEVRVRVHIEV